MLWRRADCRRTHSMHAPRSDRAPAWRFDVSTSSCIPGTPGPTLGLAASLRRQACIWAIVLSRQHRPWVGLGGMQSGSCVVDGWMDVDAPPTPFLEDLEFFFCSTPFFAALLFFFLLGGGDFGVGGEWHRIVPLSAMPSHQSMSAATPARHGWWWSTGRGVFQLSLKRRVAGPGTGGMDIYQVQGVALGSCCSLGWTPFAQSLADIRTSRQAPWYP